MKLENKVAIITGASRGIGAATALLFAKEGAEIIVNYNSSKKEAFAIVDKVRKLGLDVIAVKCDISQEKDVNKMIKKTIEKFGKIDILVNNAGIVFDVPFFDRTVEQWKQTIDINLLGTFLCSKYVAKEMLKNKTGKIINISSTNGIDCFDPESVDYDASKAGIISLTKNLAKQLAPNIQVNSIAPGWVNTDMNKNLPQNFIDEEIDKIYLKRFAEPEEIAKSILFLASDDASYITGSILKVDGGY